MHRLKTPTLTNPYFSRMQIEKHKENKYKITL